TPPPHNAPGACPTPPQGGASPPAHRIPTPAPTSGTPLHKPVTYATTIIRICVYVNRTSLNVALRGTMMNFDLDAEQSDIRDTVRRFTEQEITPHAEEWDETYHFPREVYYQMGELGLMGMTTPEEYGGSSLSRFTAALVYEEL